MPKRVETESTEEVVVAGHSVEVISRRYVNDDGSIVALIRSHGKILTVEIPPQGPVKTFLQNIANQLHVKGETTATYTAARSFLEKEAARRGTPLEYEFETGYNSMKNWAATTGTTIFRWTDQHQAIDDPQKLVARAIISPKK